METYASKAWNSSTFPWNCTAKLSTTFSYELVVLIDNGRLHLNGGRSERRRLGELPLLFRFHIKLSPATDFRFESDVISVLLGWRLFLRSPSQYHQQGQTNDVTIPTEQLRQLWLMFIRFWNKEKGSATDSTSSCAGVKHLQACIGNYRCLGHGEHQSR